MKIAPKPTPGQEVTLDELLAEKKQPEPVEETPIKEVAPVVGSPRSPPPQFSAEFNHVTGIARLDNVNIFDGNGGVTFTTIDLYFKPILVKNYASFLSMETSGVDCPHTVRPFVSRAYKRFTDWMGWTLPKGFRPACAPTLYGIIYSLTYSNKTQFEEEHDRELKRIFTPEVWHTGIYTGTWIVPQDNSRLDYAHHPDGALDQSNPVYIDFTRQILPTDAEEKPMIIQARQDPASQIRFGSDCNAIIGSQDWAQFYTLIRRKFHRTPHFRLLTQYYKKQVGSFLPLDRLPVILAADSRAVDSSLFGETDQPDQAYVFPMRVVKP